MEKKKIEFRANKVLDAFGYSDNQDSYVDSARLASSFGFKIEEEPMLEHEDGSLYVSDDGKEKYIVINDNRSLESKRLIIAHELSYYLLYYTPGNGVFIHRGNEKMKSEDKDADYMALCLLMPRKSFCAQYKAVKSGKSKAEIIASLKVCFAVPREDIERRISEIYR